MIQISNLKVELGNFTIDNISLKVNEGEYFIILGPTGAGKTIILESIAGLHPIKSGKIWLKDIDVTNLEPEKRGVGIVYQDTNIISPSFREREHRFWPEIAQNKQAGHKRGS